MYTESEVQNVSNFLFYIIINFDLRDIFFNRSDGGILLMRYKKISIFFNPKGFFDLLSQCQIL